MSEKWSFVPVFQPNAELDGIVAEIETDGGFEYSLMSLDRAKAVLKDLRALSELYVAQGPTTVGWALEWMADDITKAIDEAAIPRAAGGAS